MYDGGARNGTTSSARREINLRRYVASAEVSLRLSALRYYIIPKRCSDLARVVLFV